MPIGRTKEVLVGFKSLSPEEEVADAVLAVRNGQTAQALSAYGHEVLERAINDSAADGSLEEFDTDPLADITPNPADSLFDPIEEERE